MKIKLILAASILLMSGQVNAALLNTELVINGGAETGDITGWTSTGIEAVPATSFAVGFGSFVFTGGLGTTTQTLLQTIDVGGNSSQIDSGEIEAIFGVNLQSRSNSDFLDDARVDVSFIDGFGGALDSFFFVDTINTASFDWNFFSDTRLLSTGTRSIEILLTSNRSGGSSSDGFIDDVSFQLNSVPIPAAVWLFGTALIGLVGFSKRRKTA